mgnify:CR=1 FL=1
MSTIKTYFNLDDLERKLKPLWWQVAGLTFTASGYGRRVPTQHMVKLPGSNRWRRVYCCIYSNAGTCYVDLGGDWAVIR